MLLTLSAKAEEKDSSHSENQSQLVLELMVQIIGTNVGDMQQVINVFMFYFRSC